MPSELFPIAFLVLGVTVVVATAIFVWRLEQKRKEALASAAARLGLSFSDMRSSGLARQYQSLRGLHDGENRYAFDIIEGTHLGRSITAFDFHSETHTTDSKGNRQTSHHYSHVALLHLERPFPGVVIGPEGIFSKLAQAFGYDDIDFESHEFSRRFCVRSPDKRFAYDFCNAAMIDFLLGQPSIRAEVNDRVLALLFDGKMQPDEIESELGLACALRDRMPQYLFAAA